MRRALAILLCAALLGGCDADQPAERGTLLPAPDEALAYFPADAPFVALMETSPRAADVERLRGAVERTEPLRTLLSPYTRGGPAYPQLMQLLGNPMAVGIPFPGAAPVAALVARNADSLDNLAGAREGANRALPRGRYRGARLFADTARAFAVRDGVLLVARTTAELRRMLDTRSGEEVFTVAELDRATGRSRTRPLARAFLDVKPLLARAGARARAVPWLAAADTAGLTLRVKGSTAELRAVVRTDGEELVELDVPVSPGSTAPRVAGGGDVTVSVRDLAHTVGVGGDAALAAFPVGFLQVERVIAAVRRQAKVDLRRDVISRLHGPATLVKRGERWLLRAEPSRPEVVRRSFDRVARRWARVLAALGTAGHTGDGFLVAGDLRIGLVGDVLVAGNAPASELRSLAQQSSERPAGVTGGAFFTIDAGDWAAGDLRGWLRATPEETRLRLFAPLR